MTKLIQEIFTKIEFTTTVMTFIFEKNHLCITKCLIRATNMKNRIWNIYCLNTLNWITNNKASDFIKFLLKQLAFRYLTCHKKIKLEQRNLLCNQFFLICGNAEKAQLWDLLGWIWSLLKQVRSLCQFSSFIQDTCKLFQQNQKCLYSTLWIIYAMESKIEFHSDEKNIRYDGSIHRRQ